MINIREESEKLNVWVAYINIENEYGKPPEVWLRHIQRVLKLNEDQVQSVVKLALICLLKHKHIKFITQAAIFKFKSGVSDRGISMFEGMLREFPKRTHLWSVYLDQVITRRQDLSIEAFVCQRLP